MSDLAHLYQSEVEDDLEVVKSEKIPAGDWKSAEDLLSKCDQTLLMMEQASRSSSKKETMATCTSLRREVEALKDEVKRKALLAKPKFSEEEDDDDIESQAADEKQMLVKSGQTLQQARKNAIGLQEIGTSIVENLQRQKEVLDQASSKVSRTNSLTQKGRDLLRTIEKAQMRNKIFYFGSIAMVVVGVMLLVLWIFFKS